jgi:DNA polymerase I-like protein with 3'-5' exonuclease and polymerase domains
MQAVVPLKVPLEVDLRVGKTWGELAPYEKKIQ